MYILHSLISTQFPDHMPLKSVLTELFLILMCSAPSQDGNWCPLRTRTHQEKGT